MKHTLSALLLAAFVFASAADAQVTAAISGAVRDATNAAIPGADVTVKNLETGSVRAVATDSQGNYRAMSLPVGRHEVKAEKDGFSSALRTGIILDVGQDVVVNLSLEVGELSQQITVNEEVPLVNTTTSGVSGLVGEREVKDLPLNGRSWDNLIALNPGAANYALKSANTTTSVGNTFTVTGRRPMDNLVLLNGIEYTGASLVSVTPGGVSGGLLGIDAVREFNVQTDTYSAEYGKRSGGQVSVVTQSGSNAVHGSAFEFLRNSALDARNYFDKGPVPPLRRNQFGGALGGPLRKDRLFLFGNYEGFRQVLAQSSVAVVPDQLARLGLLPDANGSYAQVPNLNPAMLRYMQFWPVANGEELTVNGLPSGTAFAYSNPRQSIHEHYGTLRADYYIRPQDTLAFNYTIDHGTSLTPLADPLFGSYLTLRSQVASLEETHLFSSRTINTLRFGVSRSTWDYDSFSFQAFPSDLSFVAGSGPGGIVVGGSLTTTGLASITSAGPTNAANVRSHRTLYTFSDAFQAIRGPHQFSAGFWFQRVRNNDDTVSTTLGQVNFSNLQTFMQGIVSNFNVAPSRTELGWRTSLGAWYIQDTIRLRSNLNLLVGLRHEFTTGMNEATGRAANYITDGNGVLLTTPLIGSSALTTNNARLLFAPRVSLAWDLFGTGKTALRAGYGTYYTLLDALAKLDGIPPFNGILSYANVPLQSIVPILPGTPPNPSCGPGVPAPCNTYAPQGVQPDAKTPAVQQWSLRLEQQLGSKTVFRAAYIGSFGYHGLISVDANAIPAAVCAAASSCQSGGVGSTKGSVGQGMQYIPVGKRPNPYLAGGFFWYTEGNSSYNGLQLDVARRMSGGLQIRGNFTWAKNLDNNSAVQGAQANNQAQMVMDPNNIRRDWGPSALGTTAQTGISASYELPVGHGKRFFGHAAGLSDKLLSGWQLNGIATLLSGFAFTPITGSNRSGNGDSRNPDRPSLNPAFTGPVIVGGQDRWFDPNAFVLPQAGTWGNLGRGTFRGPGLAAVDLSLFKITAISEYLKLEFRAECFNLQNRANFATPNTTIFSGTNLNASAGLISSTVTTSRQLQLGMKVIF
jgi:hypothetical protein